ncbi:riboflavin synthase [Gemmatimonadota bacterium]
MFTGIVTEVGKVVAVKRETDRLSFRIEVPYEDLIEGDSIAVGGACLTVVSKGDSWFEVEAIVTTRSRTWFGDLQVGDQVNLERSVKIGDRLGGHFVQGHVDAVGEVLQTRTEADAWLIDIAVPDEIDELTVPHGSISIDGVSLTVNEMPAPNVVQVAIIPYTLEHTTLGNLKTGDKVHLEGDMIGKFVRQLLRDRQGGNPN